MPQLAALTELDYLCAVDDFSRVGALTPAQALEVLAQVLDTVEGWRAIATSTAIGLQPKELADFENAFEHEAIEPACKALGKPRSKAHG